MNLSKLSLILGCAIILIASCKKEGEPTTCTQADWVGTYEGTVDCDGEVEDASVTILARGVDSILVQYQTITTITSFTLFKVDSCEINSLGATIDGVTSGVDLSLDGDNFSLQSRLFTAGELINCEVVATRK